MNGPKARPDEYYSYGLLDDYSCDYHSILSLRCDYVNISFFNG